MVGWHYIAHEEECERCKERMTAEVVPLQARLSLVERVFCWACEDPVPADWLKEHETAEYMGNLLFDERTT